MTSKNLPGDLGKLIVATGFEKLPKVYIRYYRNYNVIDFWSSFHLFICDRHRSILDLIFVATTTKLISKVGQNQKKNFPID